jgi:flagellar protein FliO/FliZ
MKKVTLLISALLLCPQPLLAAGQSQELSMGSAVLQMLWGLLVVLGLILILYALFKRRFGIGNFSSSEIKVQEMRHLMPKSALALVEVRGRHLLLGIGSEGINLLADIGTPEDTSANFEDLLPKEQ